MNVYWRALTAGALLLLGGCKDQLYRELPAQDADSMMTILVANNIAVSRVSDGAGTYALEVDGARIADAVRILSQQGFPRSSFKSVADVFPGGGIVESPTEEKARFEFALGQEFSRTISGLAGVVWTRVHVSVGSRDLRGRSVSEPTASVLVKYTPEANLFEIPLQVREIVAGGVAGLKPEGVQVVMSPAVERANLTKAPAAISRLADNAARTAAAGADAEGKRP